MQAAEEFGQLRLGFFAYPAESRARLFCNAKVIGHKLRKTLICQIPSRRPLSYRKVLQLSRNPCIRCQFTGKSLNL
jgi:hypothetical protein